jgi:transposase
MTSSAVSWNTGWMQLTDEHWALLAPLLAPREKTTRRGRPRRDDRPLLEGILWVLRTGAQWDQRPQGTSPPKSTCSARFQEWNDRNVFPAVLGRLYEMLEDQGLLRLHEAFIDGTFSAAKKGARMLAPPKKAKGPRSWSWSMRVACHSLSIPRVPVRQRSNSCRTHSKHPLGSIAPNG